MEQLQDRVAVVTGAAGGIGLAIATRFAAEGMKVVLADIDGQVLAESVGRLADQYPDVIGVEVDVRDGGSVAAVAQTAVDRFGAIHVAVNNAGIVNRGYSWELSEADWRRVLDINLMGVIHGIREFVPTIIASGDEGYVVNVASLAAVNVISRLGPYTASKHAVLGVSDVLALDLAEVGAPVGVSVVMPGRVRSRLNPIGELDPSVVAANVVDAMRRGRRYVYTDQEGRDEIAVRLGAIVAARADVVEH